MRCVVRICVFSSCKIPLGGIQLRMYAPRWDTGAIGGHLMHSNVVAGSRVVLAA